MPRIVWEKLPPTRIGEPGGREGWVSACGSYHVWVQARVREGIAYTKEYAAQYLDEKPWLCSSAPFREAKEACQEHADARARTLAVVT